MRTHMNDCERAPGLLKLFSEKCVCACVCVYTCMDVCTYVYLFVFPHPHEQSFVHYYVINKGHIETSGQVSFGLDSQYASLKHG